MAENLCPQCGAPNDPEAVRCKYCGEALTPPAAATSQGYQTYQAPPVIQQTIYTNGGPNGNDGIDPSWPIKSKIAAGVLGILLGGLGIHKFYLGKVGQGIVYLLFCWTFVPEVIGFIEGIIYLCSNDHNFQVKHHVRLQ